MSSSKYNEIKFGTKSLLTKTGFSIGFWIIADISSVNQQKCMHVLFIKIILTNV